MPRENCSTDILTCHQIQLNQVLQEVTVDGVSHRLNRKECRLLAMFMQHPGETLSRAFIMREVWDTDYCEDTRTIEVHVSWLRKKIEVDSTNPQRILTVRGIGYLFK